MEYTKEKLVELAFEARERSYSPYSKFKVGAAILGENGKIYKGANIENASFGATVCAERTAIFGMRNDGCEKFVALAVVTDLEEDNAPCCLCRQVLIEFAKTMEAPVYVSGPHGVIYEHTLGEIVPLPFTEF